jgi:hypothetical protein
MQMLSYSVHHTNRKNTLWLLLRSFTCSQRFIFCDISRAFDRVGHTGLLYKLRKIGTDGNLLSWVTDYLDDRKQKVVLDGLTITYKDVSSAKSLILQSRSSTISFMYIRNRKGPNTDPWGTPASILYLSIILLQNTSQDFNQTILQ